MRIVLTVVISLLVTLAAVAGDCPVMIGSGTHLVTLTVYYWHEDPARANFPYTATVSHYYAGPGTVTPMAEGHPAAYQWQVDSEMVQTCGEIPWPMTPDRIWRDGFEVGSTGRWSAVVGGPSEQRANESEVVE